MKLSVNEAKLAGLGGGKSATIQRQCIRRVLPTGPKSYRALGSYLHMISTVSDGYIATRIDVGYSTRTKYKYKYTL